MVYIYKTKSLTDTLHGGENNFIIMEHKKSPCVHGLGEYFNCKLLLPSAYCFYSLLKLLIGFANAALSDWKLIVTTAITKVNKAAKAKIHQCNGVL